jgi:integrase/recombinase XerD
MVGRNFGTMSLYARQGGRKYLNSAERKRFLLVAELAPPRVRLFSFVLFWSGSRISETLALTANAIDVDDRVAIFETLKRRREGVVRQVPLPARLVRELNREFRLRSRQRDADLADEPLWPWSRTTAWRHVKRLMLLAGVSRTAAMPKGLRHAFGVAAFRGAIPPHLVQRWLGHASLETTAIYGDVAGQEEREFASRLWRSCRTRKLD